MRKELSELTHNSKVCVDPNNNILFPRRTLVQILETKFSWLKLIISPIMNFSSYNVEFNRFIYF